MLSDAVYAQRMQSMIRAAVARGTGNRKSSIAELARHLGMEAGRIRSLYYGKVRAPLAAEYQHVCDNLEAWLDKDLARLEMDRRRLKNLGRGAEESETHTTAAASRSAAGGTGRDSLPRTGRGVDALG